MAKDKFETPDGFVKRHSYGWMVTPNGPSKKAILFKFKSDAIAAAKKQRKTDASVLPIAMTVLCKPNAKHIASPTQHMKG